MKKTDKNKPIPRLVVNVSQEFHFMVKRNALENGITMSSYIIKAIIEKIDNDKQR